MDALAEAVAEHGYQRTTINDVVKRAGLPRNVFYDHFDSKEGCFLAAFEDMTSRLEEVTVKACDEARTWPEGVEAGVRSMLRLLAAEPAYTRLCFIESLSATTAIADRYEQFIVKRLTPFLEPDRIGLSPERLAGLPPTMRETIGGGIMWVIYQRTLKGEIADIETLAPEIVNFILTPYLGAGARGAEVFAGSTISLIQLIQNADQIRATRRLTHQATGAAALIRNDRDR